MKNICQSVVCSKLTDLRLKIAVAANPPFPIDCAHPLWINVANVVGTGVRSTVDGVLETKKP